MMKGIAHVQKETNSSCCDFPCLERSIAEGALCIGGIVPHPIMPLETITLSGVEKKLVLTTRTESMYYTWHRATQAKSEIIQAKGACLISMNFVWV
jgi:hypothetical protein